MLDSIMIKRKIYEFKSLEFYKKDRLKKKKIVGD